MYYVVRWMLLVLKADWSSGWKVIWVTWLFFPSSFSTAVFPCSHFASLALISPKEDKNVLLCTALLHIKRAFWHLSVTIPDSEYYTKYYHVFLFSPGERGRSFFKK